MALYQKNGKKMTNKIAISVGSVLLSMVIMSCGSSSTDGNYMEPVNNLINALNERNTNHLEVSSILYGEKEGALNRAIVEAYIEVDAEWNGLYEDKVDEASDKLDDLYDEADAEYGDWKIYFEEESTVRLEKKTLDMLTRNGSKNAGWSLESLEETLEDEDKLEDYAYFRDINEEEAALLIQKEIELYELQKKQTVEDGYDVKGKFIIETEDGTIESNTLEFRVIKCDGSWRFLAMCEDANQYWEGEEYIFTILNEMFNNNVEVVKYYEYHY